MTVDNKKQNKHTTIKLVLTKRKRRASKQQEQNQGLPIQK